MQRYRRRLAGQGLPPLDIHFLEMTASAEGGPLASEQCLVEGLALFQDKVPGQVLWSKRTVLKSYRPDHITRPGIDVQGVEIARTEAPKQVIEAFNDVLAARQDRERDLNEARRYEQQLLATAQGSAAEFNNIYEQYRLAPEVTRRRLYYETMEAVLSRTDKTVIDADGVTPYIPLREVERGRTAAAQPATPANGGQ